MEGGSADVLAPAAKDLASDVVKEVAKKVPEWLVNLVQASSPKLQQRAVQNMGNFLVRLARRVELLETELVAQGAQQMLYAAVAAGAGGSGDRVTLTRQRRSPQVIE